MTLPGLPQIKRNLYKRQNPVTSNQRGHQCYAPQPYAHFASICQSIHVYVSPIVVPL
jgi:hypothetical protein